MKADGRCQETGTDASSGEYFASRKRTVKSLSAFSKPSNAQSQPAVKPRKMRNRYLSVGLMFLPCLLLISGSKLFASAKPEAKRGAKRIRTIVDRMRHDLSIKERVIVSVVARNEKLVSVERSKHRPGTFVLSFDESFLSTLDDNELSASIAHELGHVWVFTHHPYLQTELLANQIALKVVTREDLEKIYEKVWKDKGKGDLKEFLGEDSAVGLKPEIRVKSLPKATEALNKK